MKLDYETGLQAPQDTVVVESKFVPLRVGAKRDELPSHAFHQGGVEVSPGSD